MERGQPSRSLLALLLLCLLSLGADPTDGSGAGVGEADTSFAAGGVAVGNGRWPIAFDVDAAGRIVVGSADWGEVAVQRLLADGTVDTSFGAGGSVSDPHPALYRLRDVAVSGSRVLLLGERHTSYVSGREFGLAESVSETDVVVVALTSQGVPDTSFGNGGVSVLPLPGTSETAVAMAVDSSGKVVVGATIPGVAIVLARLTAGGYLDRSFAGTGMVVHPAASDVLLSGFVAYEAGAGQLRDVAVDGSDRVLVLTRDRRSGQDTAEILRFGEDGSLDRGFGGGTGAASVPLGDPGYVSALAVAADGAIAAAGHAFGGNDCCTAHLYLAVARWDAEGVPDEEFGPGGLRTLTRWPHLTSSDVTFDASGRLLVAGTVRDSCPSGVGCDFDVALLRYLADGTLDASFGDGGWAVTSSQPLHGANAVTIQPGDGRIVVLAHLDGDGVAVARYLVEPTATPPAAPTLSAEFSSGGVDLAWTEPDDGGAAITAYRLYRAVGDDDLGFLTEVTTSAFRDTSVAPGSAYRYRVHAVNAVGEGAGSNEVTVVVPAPEAPSAPRDLAATVAKNGKWVTLDWVPPVSSGSEPLAGYRVYRAVGTGEMTLVATVGPSTTGYRDDGLARRTTYTYVVTAFNAVGEGAPSNSASATTR